MAENVEKFARHRMQNLHRFKTNLSAIIDKYDQDFPESDIVDLENFVIDKDFGYVRDHKTHIFGKAPLKVTSRIDADQLFDETRLIHEPGGDSHDEDMGRYSDDGDEEYDYHGDQASIAVYSMIQERINESNDDTSDVESINTEDSETVVSDEDSDSGDVEFSSIRPSPSRKKLESSENAVNHTESSSMSSDQVEHTSDSGYIDSGRTQQVWHKPAKNPAKQPNWPLRGSKQQTSSPRNSTHSKQKSLNRIQFPYSTQKDHTSHGATSTLQNHMGSKNTPHQLSKSNMEKDSDIVDESEDSNVANDTEGDVGLDEIISPDTSTTRRSKDFQTQSNERSHKNSGAKINNVGDTVTNKVKSPHEKFKKPHGNSTFIIPPDVKKQSYVRPSTSPGESKPTQQNQIRPAPLNQPLESTRISEIMPSDKHPQNLHDGNIHKEDGFNNGDIHDDHLEDRCKTSDFNHIPVSYKTNNQCCNHGNNPCTKTYGNHGNQTIVPAYQDGNQFSNNYLLSSVPSCCCSSTVYPSSSTIVHVCPMYSTSAITNVGRMNESLHEHLDGSCLVQHGHQITPLNNHHGYNQPQIGNDGPNIGSSQLRIHSNQLQLCRNQHELGNQQTVNDRYQVQNSRGSQQFLDDKINQLTNPPKNSKPNDGSKQIPGKSTKRIPISPFGKSKVFSKPHLPTRNTTPRKEDFEKSPFKNHMEKASSPGPIGNIIKTEVTTPSKVIPTVEVTKGSLSSVDIFKNPSAPKPKVLRSPGGLQAIQKHPRNSPQAQVSKFTNDELMDFMVSPKPMKIPKEWNMFVNKYKQEKLDMNRKVDKTVENVKYQMKVKPLQSFDDLKLIDTQYSKTNDGTKSFGNDSVEKNPNADEGASADVSEDQNNQQMMTNQTSLKNDYVPDYQKVQMDYLKVSQPQGNSLKPHQPQAKHKDSKFNKGITSSKICHSENLSKGRTNTNSLGQQRIKSALNLKQSPSSLFSLMKLKSGVTSPASMTSPAGMRSHFDVESPMNKSGPLKKKESSKIKKSVPRMLFNSPGSKTRKPPPEPQSPTCANPNTSALKNSSPNHKAERSTPSNQTITIHPRETATKKAELFPSDSVSDPDSGESYQSSEQVQHDTNEVYLEILTEKMQKLTPPEMLDKPIGTFQLSPSREDNRGDKFKSPYPKGILRDHRISTPKKMGSPVLNISMLSAIETYKPKKNFTDGKPKPIKNKALEQDPKAIAQHNKVVNTNQSNQHKDQRVQYTCVVNPIDKEYNVTDAYDDTVTDDGTEVYVDPRDGPNTQVLVTSKLYGVSDDSTIGSAKDEVCNLVNSIKNPDKLRHSNKNVQNKNYTVKEDPRSQQSEKEKNCHKCPEERHHGNQESALYHNHKQLGNKKQPESRGQNHCDSKETDKKQHRDTYLSNNNLPSKMPSTTKKVPASNLMERKTKDDFQSQKETLVGSLKKVKANKAKKQMFDQIKEKHGRNEKGEVDLGEIMDNDVEMDTDDLNTENYDNIEDNSEKMDNRENDDHVIETDAEKKDEPMKQPKSRRRLGDVSRTDDDEDYIPESEALVTTDLSESTIETSEASETCTLVSTEGATVTSNTGETMVKPYLENPKTSDIWTLRKSTQKQPNCSSAIKGCTHFRTLKTDHRPIIGSPKFTSTILERTSDSFSPKRRRSLISMSSDLEQSHSRKKYKLSGYECDVEDSDYTCRSGKKMKVSKNKTKIEKRSEMEKHNQDISVCNGPGNCSKSFCFDCIDG